MERKINFYPGIGGSAHLTQHTELLLPSLYFEHPHLFLIQQGQTRVRWGKQETAARTGDLLIVGGGKTVDLINSLSDNGIFSCQMLICDPSLSDNLSPTSSYALSSPTFSGAATLPKLPSVFLHSFDTTVMAFNERFPLAITRHKMREILLWLAHWDIHFPPSQTNTLTQQARRYLANDPNKIWSVAEVAEHLAMNEVMLRRKLSLENTSLRNLMIDVRMSSALVLLQATDWSISAIAQHVGYESSSRFAERFRKRFGFAPTAIRGHQRTVPPLTASLSTSTTQ